MAVCGPLGDSSSKKDGANHCGEIKMYHKKTVSGVNGICLKVGTSGRVF